MLGLAAAFILTFAPHPGWTTGSSGSGRSAYGGAGVESTAWTATGVRYRDRATADPPNRTLAHLPRRAVIVWAVAFTPVQNEPRLRLSLARARHLPCCEGEYVAGGSWELAGRHGNYSVIVRIYFGSPPTRSMRSQAQHALDQLALPLSR